MALNIPQFDNTRVLIVGDVMLDRYWHGDTKRISPEAPVPIVHVGNIDERPGGAGNVALNLASLGVKTDILGMVGDDLPGRVLAKKLEEAGVTARLHISKEAPTITKLRVISFHQQLIRLDFEHSFNAADHRALEKSLEDSLSGVSVVILSDYYKGTLSESQILINKARERGIPVFVDPKGADFSRYSGASLLTPNRKEFEAVVGPCNSDEEIVERGKQILKDYNIGALLVTRGSEGMSLIQRDEPPMHLTVRSYDVYDVTGAGDTVIAVVSAGVAAGLNLRDATRLSNIAASIVVTKLGAASVTVTELRRAMRKENASLLSILSEDEAINACLDAKSRKKKVVMTNGCFDFLHPGHIGYLEAAKSQGDRLIVAINDDDSIRRLKGDSRPINTLHDRMLVLAALRAVDWVVPFSEDTPESLIEKIKPDVLVKGMDYDGEDVPGKRFVEQNGGQVVFVGPEKNWSNTDTIEKIKNSG